MARRTIRARRASPYLLYLVIAFSVLTVACAIGWAWMYSLKSQVELNVFGQARIEGAPEIEDLWRGVLDNPEYKETGDNLVDILDKKVELANTYRSEIQRLTERLAGDPFTTQRGNQLRQSVSDVLKSTNDILVQTEQAVQESYAVGGDASTADVKTTSMVAAIRSLVQRVKALVLQVKQDATAVGDLEGKITGLQEELAAAKAEHTRQTAQLQQNLDDEKTRITTARDSAVQQSEQFKEEMQRITDRLIAERGTWAKERDKLSREVLTLQNNLKEMAQEIAAFRKVPTETGVDGHIVSIAEQGQTLVAYGDLGKKDGVLLGMTFSIFSPSELGKTLPKPKAQCRIVKIMDNSCELRIYEIQRDSPVVIGDVLHNPVYDRSRRMRFVLVGKMDIDGDGLDDSEQLKALIQDFGGKTDPALTVQADFLIVGEEPTVVAPPAADASPQERVKYEEHRKAFIQYTEAKARAENFSIPVLSLNPFLGLVGIAGES
ncbi:MAG: hypothetical protein IMZ55_04510 [Acidobacteria bacterium]|nr:hypothetical protein [Acidobacteriota bacterium]